MWGGLGIASCFNSWSRGEEARVLLFGGGGNPTTLCSAFIIFSVVQCRSLC